MQSPGPRHWAMLGYLTVFWGLAFFLIAVGLRGLPPLTLVVVRLAVGALALYPLMRWQGGQLPVESACFSPCLHIE